jgi:outer membrane protein assembly factor BamB
MAPRLLLAFFLCASLLASAGSAAVGMPAWPQFHYNAAHTGFNAGERALTRANAKRLRQAWAVHAGASIEGSVAVGGGLVLVGSDDNVMHAYRLDGSEAWSRTLEHGAAFVASPATDGQRVFGYSSSAVVTALDTSSGDQLWQKPVSSVRGVFPGSPTIVGQTVYVVPYELVALDTATGAVRWTRPNVGCFICSPAVAKGTLFIGAGPASGRRVLALDAATGAPRWSFRPQAGKDFSWSASPAVSGGRVFQVAFVGGNNAKAYSLYAFAAATGKRLWKTHVGSSEFLTSSSPAVANGIVYYVSPGARFYALRASNGKVLWSKAIATSASSPAVAGGVVYFGAGLTMYGLDARTGKTLWRGRTTANPSDPAVAGGTVYVGSGDGITRAYRPPAG